MKVVVDKQRQLNYHPLVVYVVLSPSEHVTYAKSIARLNNCKGLTRGLFKFRAVTRGDKYSADLSSELAAAINRFNVILRLVDDSEGNYNYALENINLDRGTSLFESSLQDFVINSCKQNIKILKSLLEFGADDEAMLSGMIQGFRDAVSFNDVVHSTSLPSGTNRFGALWGESDELLSSVDPMRHPQLPPDIAMIRDSLYGVLPDRKAKDAFKKMMAFFELKMEVVDMEESDRYAQGTVDNAKSEDFRADVYSRNKHGERPNIIIHITRILPDLRKRVRKVWGIEITIGDVTTPIYIGSVAAAIVYIAALLKQKMGTRLSREAFKHALPGRESIVPRHEDVIWLKSVYRTLYPGAGVDFDQWYASLRNDGFRAVSQGKSEANRIVKAKMKLQPEALYYCMIQADKAANEINYYIDIPSENIILSPELLSIVEVK